MADHRVTLLGRLLAASAAAVLVASLGAPPTLARAPGDPTITKLGAAPGSYSFGDPDVLVTRDGVTLVAWNQYLDTPNSIRLVRKKPGAPFDAIPVPRAGLEAFDNAYLTEDLVNDRILLTAQAHGDTLDDLGLYVWRSKNNGKTWSQPTRVWDSFASGQIALDGAGGFWAISDLTWAVVTHVPSSLAMQHWPDDHVVLSDRFASRGAVDIATTGSMRRLLFAWGSGANEAWVHVGSAADNDDDVRVMQGLYADGATQLAGDKHGAVLGAIRQIATSAGNRNRLYAAGIVAEQASTSVYRGKRISGLGEDVVDFSIAPRLTSKGRPTGLFVAVWTDANGRVRTAHSTRRGNPTWSSPQTVLRFPTQGFSYPSSPDVADDWVALGAYSKSLREVRVALRLR